MRAYTRLVAPLVRYAHIAALLAVLVAAVFLHLLPRTPPLDFQLRSLIDGSGIALQALGLVLVFRANRLINFAQAQLGLLSAVLFTELVGHLQLVQWVGSACGCITVGAPGSRGASFGIGGVVVTSAPGGTAGALTALNYWLSLAICLGIAVLLSWLTYVLVIRRFANAPRLVPMVATLALAQVFTLAAAIVPRFWLHPGQTVELLPAPAPPIGWHFKLPSGGVLQGADLLTAVVAVGALIGLGAYLRYTRAGVSLRAAAENPQRAASLGVRIGSVTGISWMAAGALSGVAALLGAMSSGSQADPASQVLIIGSAALGGFLSLPVTVLAAIVLTVVRGGVVWAYQTPVLFHGFLLALLVGLLLLRRRQEGRTDGDLSAGWEGMRESRPIPRPLRALSQVRRAYIWTLGLVALAAAALPWLLSGAQAGLGAVIWAYAIVGLSLLVLTGWAGHVSLGQFAFAGVGAYVAAVAPVPFAVQVLLGGLAASLAAVLVGLPALRLSGLYLAVTTLAFALAVQSILLSPSYFGSRLPASLTRPSVLGIDLNDQHYFYYFALALLVLALLATVGLRHSRTARVLIATRDNEPLAQSYGVNLTRARLTAYALAGFMAGIGGVLFVFAEGNVNPGAFGPDTSLSLFLMTVIGGLGSLAGPVLGAVYYGALSLLSSDPLVAVGGTGFLALGLLIASPGGLGQVVYAMRDAFLRRLAERYRISVPTLLGAGTAQAARLAPKVRRGGGRIFIPVRYRPKGQWALPGGSDPR